jgi:molybdopterin-guanine dinucleotide biosynthesis protein A
MTDLIKHSILGVVLCGGKSSRMGRDKGTMRLQNGMSFIDHAIERLKPICDEVCLAGRLAASVNLIMLPDPTPHQGPIFGVIAAISLHAKTDSSLRRWIEHQPAAQVALEESHCRNINRPEDLI